MQRALSAALLTALILSSGCKKGSSATDSVLHDSATAASSATDARPAPSGSVGRRDGAATDSSGSPSAPPSFGPGPWHLVPDNEVSGSACHVYTAAGAGPFEPFAWTSCGADCETADITAGLGPWVATSAASTRRGTAYAFWAHPLGEGVGRDFLSHIVRLRDGVTIAAMGVQFGGATCANSYFPNTALILWHMAGPTGAERQAFGLATEPSRGWTWTPSVLASTVPQTRVAFDVGDRIIGLGMGAVYSLVPPSSKWETLESPSSSLFGAGGDDLAAWVESDSARLRAWSADGAGVRTLADSLPAKTCVLAVGSTSVLTVASDGCLGASNGVKLYETPLAGPSRTPRLVTKLPGPVYVTAPDALRTGGDYAALLAWTADENGTRTGPPFFFVVRLSTGKAWRVDSRAPLVIQDTTWTLDGSYLYWGERNDSELENAQLRRMARIDLSKIDSFGKPVSG